MSLIDFRMAIDLRWAARTTPPFTKSSPSNAAARNGLRYEQKVGRELARHTEAGRFVDIEHNPWFQFADLYGSAQCSPDFLLYTEKKTIIIVEVKLTWVEVAIHKLNDLYNPVISTALARQASSLLICRNLTSKAPPASATLSAALASPYRLLHWPEIGQMRW